MTLKIVRSLLLIVLAFSLGSARAMTPLEQGLIPTDQVAAPQSERERVKALVARPEVAKKLQQLGVLPKDAQSRIDALTDAEVTALAGRIDAVPAGGFSDQNWLLVIIVILLLIIVL